VKARNTRQTLAGYKEGYTVVGRLEIGGSHSPSVQNSVVVSLLIPELPVVPET